MEIIAIISLALLAIVVFFGLYWIIKKADQFHKEADLIQKMMQDGVDMRTVHHAILLLNTKSFHKTTHQRIRELAKMFAIKYGHFITR